MNNLTDYQRANCRKLARILKDVPPREFKMSTWITSAFGCGTVGCAMGWAAMSGRFNFGYGVRHQNPTTRKWSWARNLTEVRNWVNAFPFDLYFFPIRNGEVKTWVGLAREEFGDEALIEIFLRTHLTKYLVRVFLLRLASGKSLQ